MRRNRPILMAGVMLAVLALAGCSSGGGSNDSSAGSDSGSSASRVAGGVAVDQAGAPAARLAQDASSASQAPQQVAVISTGDVSLGSRDVGAVVAGVRQAVAGYGGSVQKESTDTDDRGRAVSSDMTLRVPSDRFEAAMHDLAGLGTLESTASNTKDVTTVVLDNQVRVRVAQRSIDRITALLDQATSIKEVISIESELAQRQADLASLESQQKYLADQTSMATIRVSVDRSSTAPPAEKTHTGFAAGLAAGWNALDHTGTAVATALGALLPWLVVLGLLGGVALPARRLVRRHRSAAGSSAEA